MALEANTTRIDGNCQRLRPVQRVRRDPARQLPPRMFLRHRRNRKPVMRRLRMTIKPNNNNNRIRSVVEARVASIANLASRTTITAIATVTATAIVTDIPVTVAVARVARRRLRVTTRVVPTM